MNKFDEIMEKLDNAPRHTGYDIDGLITVGSYITNLVKETIDATYANELNQEESTQILDILNTSVEKIKGRLDKVKKSDEHEQIKAKSREMLKKLEIKYCVQAGEDAVKITDLYELFSSENRVDEVVRKLKMRAFW